MRSILSALALVATAIASAATNEKVEIVSGSRTTGQSASAIVVMIQKADFEGDRTELNRLYDELVTFVDEPAISSRVRYWRGFAKWRRAINGANETPIPTDLVNDLAAGEGEFAAALEIDPALTDAKIGASSCIVLRLYFEHAFSKGAGAEDIARMLSTPRRLLNEAQQAAPDNPRLLWVVGQNEWNLPPPATGQARAIATYLRGLESARRQQAADILEPTWGEPELLMNLAWANLHRTPPDPVAAEAYARQALAMVPNWHYVRDILLPQISNAKTSQD